ncbi:unnamed protein product [Paramecium pentaurelia]|uniref:Uncharacterized protein n=1 Tax=Paramecium pentaurelia TaxID=43138 RepID=A0A8S1U7L9_9CILI|nr:unnamed protein product [Paramecium pentaurelia]
MKTRRKIHVEFNSPKHEEPSSPSIQQSENDEDSTFPLTKTIKNMLYVYGDQRKSEVHNLAHLQIQELISDIFQPLILHALYSPAPKPWEEMGSDIKFEFPQPLTKNKRILQNYLNCVFKEFVSLFQKLSRISKRLKKHASEVNQDNNLDYETTLRNKAQKEKILVYEEQYSQQEDSVSNSSITSESPHEIWEEYMKARVEKMPSQEFIKFMELRSQTFIHHKRFKQFIDPHQYGQNFIECINLKFLNYCLCRVIKRIIQNVMQSEQPQSQVFQLSEEHLKKYGYQIIETYKIRAKKYALQDQKLNQMAYKLFLQEFCTQGYDAYFQSKWVLKKSGQLSSNQEVRAQEEWDKMGNIKQKWIDRVKAEKQVRQKLVKQKEVIPNTPYSRILLQRVGNKSYEQAKSQFSTIFKEWFIHLETITEIDSIYD